MKKRLQVPTAAARRIGDASCSVFSATSQGEEIAQWNPDHDHHLLPRERAVGESGGALMGVRFHVNRSWDRCSQAPGPGRRLAL